MPTGSRVKVLGTASQYLISSIYYDHWGRAIQTLADNQSTGVDIATNQYDFSGKMLSSYLRHQKNNAPVNTVTILTKMEYDHAGRVKNTKKIVNGGTEKTLAQNSYDELGKLITKVLSPTGGAGGGPLETLDYKYNIRGWMQGINRGYANANYGTESTNQANRWFGMELMYDYGFVKNQYNGNIGGIRWKSNGDDEQRAYGFDYDNLNRLLKADFNQYTSSAWNVTAGIDFSLSNMTYDANGNIMTMNQKGLKLNVSPTIDQLTYTYTLNTNRLAKVADAALPVVDNGKLGDFKDGTNGTGNDYVFDVNGNLTLDHNKAISSITYNHLNLPLVITVTGKGTITYTYDAAGAKQKKVTLENPSAANGNITTTTTTTYIGGFVYETRIDNNPLTTDYTDQLQFIAHEEGRIRFVKATTSTCIPQPDRFIFDYFLKDHLGNIRMVLTEQKEDICYIPATVEDASYQTEDDIYSITNARRIDKATTGATQSSFGNKLYRAHGGLANEKTGLAVTLKVMAGDQVKITAESFHTIPGGGPGSTTALTLTELLSAFTGSGAILSTKGVVTPATVSSIGNNTTQLNAIVNSTNGTGNARAFVNWILFDEQLKYVAGNVVPS